MGAKKTTTHARPAKLRPSKIRSSEVRLFKACFDKVRPVELRLAEVYLISRILFSPQVPDLHTLLKEV
jgi:hypothetical protein